jgi:hypothetical protein
MEIGNWKLEIGDGKKGDQRTGKMRRILISFYSPLAFQLIKNAKEL